MPTEPELKARISLDGSGWEAGMRQVQSSIKGFVGSLGEIKNLIATAFTVTAIAHQTQKVIEFGSKIHDLSVRFGISTDALQEFDYAARLTGSSLDSFVGAIRKLTVSQVEAVRDGGPLIKQFAALGVHIDDLKSKRPEEIFKQIAENIRAGNFSSEQFAALIKVMGRSADGILPAIREGLAGMAEELDRIGGKLGPDAIKHLDDYGDAWTRMTTKIRGAIAETVIAVGWFGRVTANALALAWARANNDIPAIEDAIVERTKLFPALFNKGPVKAQDPLMGLPDIENPGDLAKSKLDKVSAVRQQKESLIPFNSNINEMQRVGEFIGGPDRTLVSIQERALQKLDQIERNTGSGKVSGGGEVIFP